MNSNPVLQRCCERCKMPWNEHILAGEMLRCPTYVSAKDKIDALTAALRKVLEVDRG